jgi:hypothetical protein
VAYFNLCMQGGRNITTYFRTLVPALSTYTSPPQTVTVADAKEKTCYVAFDYAASLSGTTESLTYDLGVWRYSG